MSGMHLLPVYYTTTNHKSKRKKPRKISRAQEEAQRKHDKFLKKMGVPLNYVAPEPAPLELSERVNQLPQKKIQDMDWSPCPKKNTPTLSGDYIVGQAYNKGNYQVLSKDEAADESTGKRR
jgi:hypothetical protein